MKLNMYYYYMYRAISFSNDLYIPLIQTSLLYRELLKTFFYDNKKVEIPYVLVLAKLRLCLSMIDYINRL